MPDKKVIADDHIFPEFNVRDIFMCIFYKTLYKNTFYYVTSCFLYKTKARTNFKVGGEAFLNNLYAFKLDNKVYNPSYRQCV